MDFLWGAWGAWGLLAVPPLALLLDLWLGDPRGLPHPVCGVGRMLRRAEVMARRHADGLPEGERPAALRRAGVLAVMVVAGGVALAVWGLVRLPVLAPWPGALAAVYFAWAGLALGSLLREGRCTLHAIEHGTLDEARAAVSMLVSRDTAQLDRPDLRRALAETLAENFNDGFVAPLFWLLLGGPAALWGYKAVSTMDSMWGYRTDRWRDLGRACARLDDVLAWLPARLSALFLWLSAPLVLTDKGPGGARGGWQGFGPMARDARSMESPNAGWPMSAAAWLHGAPMGGPTPYFGVVKDKPVLGPRPSWNVAGCTVADASGTASTSAPVPALASGPAPTWDAERLQGLLRHLRVAGLAATGCLWAGALLLRVLVM
ncbi:CobD/CbiB family cobalamin biosynthesis protein [Nitratidesulfovibrio sp. SRB-5]|uniref:CobD/CbiB family cobalamin biosynthesis protein n=1 Tax=Nitratidesulfovibrio sp. SRB-5 TaxID=2872636 RepID=UPI001CBADF57|nr:CobD/CbiB family cobalamin biosynthesis protein [Nitratidesulfovibrio sp. SRB-5]MBZ2172850.1 cobalamin biosynthesis protein [Nitratidesulfovibrio sp. SRB-5]